MSFWVRLATGCLVLSWLLAAEVTTQLQPAAVAGPSEQPLNLTRLRAESRTVLRAATGYVWFEAESPDGEAHVQLSGGRMIWNGPRTAIQKIITIPTDGTYTLWVRRFWNPQSFRWRVGEGDLWKSVANPPLQDLVDLGPGRKVGWLNAGEVILTAGAKTFRFEVTDEDKTTAYDCFVLTREAFQPRGKLKPDDTVQVSEPGWFAFQPKNDSFDSSPIDLRGLNERQAGDHGFVRAKGEDFVYGGSDEPVRFWAVNIGPDLVRRSKAEVELFARTMAKRGVNLVRIHGPIYEGAGSHLGRINTNYVAQLDDAVAALKREGIYTALSIYFPLWLTLGSENTAFPGYPGKNPFALLYFDPAFQQMYRDWWEYLLTHPNQHSGLTLRDDPAVAMLELVNEDSTLFWTFNPDAGAKGNVPDTQRVRWEAQFGDWLKRKYPGKTLDQIRSETWAGLNTAQDDFPAGRVGFRSLWAIANERKTRDQDTAAFLADVQLKFYRETYTWLKDTLKVRALVYGSNWKTASAQYLDPLDKWSNAHADFLDRHGYFGGSHTGEASGYAIQVGQKYDDRSALRFVKAEGRGEEFELPLWDLIYNGQPSTLTEVNWTPPNRFRTEYPLLAAATGAIQGSDAIFHFAAGTAAWDGVPPKFGVQSPALLGQFPATALIFRRGLIKTAPRVVELQLALRELTALKGTPLPAPQNFDQLRGSEIPPGGVITNQSAIDSLAFVVGRVAVDFVTNGSPRSRMTDLSPYINRAAKTVRSQTGEFVWDWGRGLATLRAPAAQGVAGFIGGAGPVDLPDVTIESALEYGAVIVVALDGKPIASSEKLLLQVMSEEKPYQWATDAPTGLRTITNAGQPPLLIRELSGTIKLKRPDAANLRVTPLDFNGYRDGSPTLHGTATTLQKDRLYYLVEP